MTQDSQLAITEYLALMEETEAARWHVVWSLIGTVAALIGGNTVFRSGPMHKVTANLFVVILGPAGVRKSSAINQVTKLLDSTSLNFGPTDTGGQRHGLMSALSGFNRPSVKASNILNLNETFAATLAQLKPRRSNDMFLVAPELGRLMGVGSREMADFMVDLWDSAEIKYQTKTGEVNLKKSIASLLAATTPSSLASCLPENAATHGILSRMIFVYEGEKYKNVPLPPEPTEDWWSLRDSFIRKLQWIDGNREDYTLSDSARTVYKQLYTYQAHLGDARLAHYQERRATMLLKVGMCLAALRMSTIISESDLTLAHQLLEIIEPNMHKALEYFGKNRTYQGRMLMVQYLRQSQSGIASREELIAIASSELNQRDAEEAINGMVKSKELIQLSHDKYILGEAKAEFDSAKKAKEEK